MNDFPKMVKAKILEINGKGQPTAIVTIKKDGSDGEKLQLTKKPAAKKPAPSLTAQLKAAKAEIKQLKLNLSQARDDVAFMEEKEEASKAPQPSLLRAAQASRNNYDAATNALIDRLCMRLAGLEQQ